MPGLASPIPSLPTFDHAPSWFNRSGRVDRSACLELHASDLWRKASFKKIPRRAFDPDAPHLEAITTIVVSARWLSKLHHARNPLKLKGDWRTSKSNAMKNCKTQGWPSLGVPHNDKSHRAALERFDGDFLKSHPMPANNPNKGAGFSKMLGLWEDWTQEVTIEKWWQHEMLTQHFLVCPNQGFLPPLPLGEGRGEGVGRGEGRGEGSSPNSKCQIPKSCSPKSLILFMPLCTEAEVLDAELAEGWIKMTESRYAALGKPLPPNVIEKRQKLLERYGVLFRGRRLLCRKCLGMRYGEVKAKRVTARHATE